MSSDRLLNNQESLTEKKTALQCSKMPTQVIEQVFHIGTLDPGQKGEFSWEGHGLSISLDPEAWEKIAKLGGFPWWRLQKTGGSFLDYHRLSSFHRGRATRWGLREGYCVEKTGYEFSYYDDELEDDMRFTYTDRDEALVEAEGVGADEESVLLTTILVATDKLRKELHLKVDINCFDQLFCLWAERFTSFDGVWWDDQYGFMSAPRGVIFPSRLANWERFMIDEAS